MLQYDIFDEAGAKQRRDKGTALALAKSEEWADIAIGIIRRCRPEYEGKEFPFETLRAEIVRQIGEPKSSSAWGGLALKAVKEKLLCDTMKVVHSKRLKRRYGKTTLWKFSDAGNIDG